MRRELAHQDLDAAVARFGRNIVFDEPACHGVRIIAVQVQGHRRMRIGSTFQHRAGQPWRERREKFQRVQRSFTATVQFRGLVIGVEQALILAQRVFVYGNRTIIL